MILKKSQELFHRGKDIVAQDRDDLDKFPCFVKRGKGAYVWDIDGNKYIDFTCAKGPIILGYSDDRVDNAVIEHIRQNGNLFFTQYSDLKLQLAEKLIEYIPCAERVLFFRTGSCAATAAIRIARAYSRKDVVLTSGYHGWHDWALKMFPEFKSYDKATYDFGYNIEVLSELISKYKNIIACIFITPEPNFFPDSLLLQIKEIANRNNIILIFDEVKTGFRFTLGGYQKYSGIIPDMATFSKGMANGYSISCVAGNKQIMEAADKTHLWGTYHSEQISFVAALKTIEVIEKEDVINHIWRIGKYFIGEMEKLVSKYNFPISIIKHPSVFHLVIGNSSLSSEFFKQSLSKGILFYHFDNQMVSFSHTPDDIDKAIEIIKDVFDSLPANIANIEENYISSYIRNECGAIL